MQMSPVTFARVPPNPGALASRSVVARFDQVDLAHQLARGFVRNALAARQAENGFALGTQGRQIQEGMGAEAAFPLDGFFLPISIARENDIDFHLLVRYPAAVIQCFRETIMRHIQTLAGTSSARKFLAALGGLWLLLGVSAALAQEVNLYSARHYESDKTLYALFEQETGIKVNVVSAPAPELIERIKREGEATNADLFLTVDGGVLNTAKNAGILQAIASPLALQNVPAALRERENHWIGITTRARVIVYSKARVQPDQLSTYEDLASPKWKGKIVARPSSALYDQSLLASLIALNGEEKALAWVKGVAANFARPPKGNDRAQAKDIAAGIGDVALMNTYYIGQMLHSKDPEEVRAAQEVGIFFPNQETTGTHRNVSGVALTKYAKNQKNALRFIEFLTSVPAQERLSADNYEFPTNPKAKRHPLLESWGAFKTQEVDFSALSTHNAKAIRFFAEGGWK
jgi:iron(III) transport system substrate-binding protein